MKTCKCGCGQEVKPPRRAWATQKCVDDWNALHDWNLIRRNVELRDRCICARCGIDCRAVETFLYLLECGVRRYAATSAYWSTQVSTYELLPDRTMLRVWLT